MYNDMYNAQLWLIFLGGVVNFFQFVIVIIGLFKKNDLGK